MGRFFIIEWADRIVKPDCVGSFCGEFFRTGSRLKKITHFKTFSQPYTEGIQANKKAV
jgi:hypothetical protein